MVGRVSSSCRVIDWVRFTRFSNPLSSGATERSPERASFFAAPPDVLASIRAIETWARQIAPAVVWHSAIREPGTFSGSVKAKINVSGPNACRLLGMSGKPLKCPENWVRLSCIPIVEFRGVYAQKTGSGLILHVTHLMIGEIESEPAKPCEFL